MMNKSNALPCIRFNEQDKLHLGKTARYLTRKSFENTKGFKLYLTEKSEFTYRGTNEHGKQVVE